MQQISIPIQDHFSSPGPPSSISRMMLLKSFVLNDQTPLPLAGTRSGSLFTDRFNPNLKWYLPKYQLAADPDPFFSFVASQSGTDGSGHPFNKGMLTMTLQKTIPDDVQTLKLSNPALQFLEIVLLNAAASLTTTFVDATTGQNSQNHYEGKVVVNQSGDLQLTFDNIIGPGLIILYDNLQQTGAGISVSFNYEAWVQSGFKRVFVIPPHIPATIPAKPFMARPLTPMVSHSTVMVQHFTPQVVQNAPVVPGNSTVSSGTDTFQKTSMAISFQLLPDNKYNTNAYSLKFIISSGGGAPRPIINVNDLVGFNLKQSEFKELTIFGDIRSKYPSISRLYIGSLSRTIMVIPVIYSLVRSTNGLSALCQALLDSASGSNSSCKFEFTLILAPDVSPIELIQLTQDIATIPELQSYSIVLPNYLKEGTFPTLLSAFQNVTQGSNTADQHFFALGIEVKDQNNDSPAIASANMLLGQLCQDHDPYLLATLSLKLDDNFPDPVETNALLNFHKSTGTDDLAFSVDNNLKTITFLNNSPFDLVISRYAIVDGSNINVFPVNLVIESSQSTSVPFSSSSASINIMADSEIDAPGIISKNDISKYMTFQTQDVQSTKFNFGINAASVDFDTPGISQIDVLITIAGLPGLSIPQFSLVKLHAVDSSFALIPIQNAITSLLANVSLTIHHIDASKADTVINLQHQFIDMPILILQNQDLSPS